MTRSRCIILAALAAVAGCRLPDAIETGISHRNEAFGGSSGIIHEDYTGQQLWVGATWFLRPRETVVRLDAETRLWATETVRHKTPSGDKPTEVNVNLPKSPDAPKGVVGEVGDLLDRGRNEAGDYTMEGVLALGIVALLAVLLVLLRPKQSK
jgi:hypothetical protein